MPDHRFKPVDCDWVREPLGSPVHKRQARKLLKTSYGYQSKDFPK